MTPEQRRLAARPKSLRERLTEKRWLASLDDRELSRVARALTAVDRAVGNFRMKDAA